MTKKRCVSQLNSFYGAVCADYTSGHWYVKKKHFTRAKCATIKLSESRQTPSSAYTHFYKSLKYRHKNNLGVINRDF